MVRRAGCTVALLLLATLWAGLPNADAAPTPVSVEDATLIDEDGFASPTSDASDGSVSDLPDAPRLFAAARHTARSAARVDPLPIGVRPAPYHPPSVR